MSHSSSMTVLGAGFLPGALLALPRRSTAFGANQLSRGHLNSRRHLQLASPAAPLLAELGTAPACGSERGITWNATAEGLAACSTHLQSRAAASGKQANAEYSSAEFVDWLVTAAPAIRAMPVHQRYQALLHAYTILSSVPLEQGLLRRALAYVDAEFERANYAVVGSYEWTLIPMKDFPLTVEEMLTLMEQCVSMGILPPGSTFARMLHKYVDGCVMSTPQLMRLFAVWLAAGAEHGCLGCPMPRLYRSALRTLLRKLHTLTAAELLMLVECQHAERGPFGNTAIYQTYLPDISKAAVLSMNAGRLSHHEAVAVVEASVEAAGAACPRLGAELQADLDAWMVYEALVPAAPAALLERAVENNIAAWARGRQLASLLSLAVVAAVAVAVAKA